MKASYQCQRMIGSERCGNSSPQNFCHKHRNGQGATIADIEVAKVRTLPPKPVAAVRVTVEPLDDTDGLETNYDAKPNSIPKNAMYQGKRVSVVAYHPKNERRDGLFEIRLRDEDFIRLVGRQKLTFISDSKAEKIEAPTLF